MIFTLLHYMYIQQLTSMALQTANIVFYLFANRHIKTWHQLKCSFTI